MIGVHFCAVCGAMHETLGDLWNCEESHTPEQRQRVVDYRRAHPEEFDDYRGDPDD